MAKTNEGLSVVRKTYKKNGKEYYNYVVLGKVRGKEVSVSLIPSDIGGYALLDIVFNNENTLPLSVTKEQYDNNGTLIDYLKLEVTSSDETTGEIFSATVKTTHRSDKQLLDMLIRQIGISI
jgi:hypothetical protein